MAKNGNNIDEGSLKKQVSAELSEAKNFVSTLNIDDVKQGGWFTALLMKVVQSYDRNVRAEYFQQKYPGLTPDEISDILINVTVRYATIAGGITGATTTLNQVTVLSTAGATAAIMAGAIGVEMVYLARIQMRLILDLAVVYDLQLDSNDPEDVMMIFNYAIGITPIDVAGRGLQAAAGAGTKYAVKKYISKGTLKSVQTFGKRIGVKILQRTIIKYAVPVASAAMGSGFNYLSTKYIGKIAKSHFKSRGKVTEELRLLISKKNTYDLSFIAAVKYMEEVGGKVTPKKKELYKAIVSRMQFEKHTQEEFQQLISTEENIIAAVKRIDDESIRSNLVEVLALMAIYDGEFADEEKAFLLSLSSQLNIAVDIEELEKQCEDYKVIVKKNFFEKTSEAAAHSLKKAANSTGNAVSNTTRKIFKTKKG